MYCRGTAGNRPSSFACSSVSLEGPLVAIQRNRIHLKCTKKGMFPITSLLRALSASVWESRSAGHEVLEILMEEPLYWNKRKKEDEDVCRRGSGLLDWPPPQEWSSTYFFMVEHMQKINLFHFSSSGFEMFLFSGCIIILRQGYCSHKTHER